MEAQLLHTRTITEVLVLLFVLVTACDRGADVDLPIDPFATASEWRMDSIPEWEAGVVSGEVYEEFHDVVTVRIIEDSLLFVADRGANALQVFDLHGQYRATLGGAGEGPGEMRFLWRATPAPEGGMLVVDNVLRRATWYFGDGSVETEHLPEPPPEEFLAPLLMGRVADVWIAAANDTIGTPEPGEVIQSHARYEVMGPDGFVSGKEILGASIRWYGPVDGRPAHFLPYSPQPVVAFNRSIVVALTPQERRVWILDDTLQWSSFELPVRCPSIDPSVLADGTSGEELRRGTPLSELAEHLPECAPPYGQAMVTSTGHIWVELPDGNLTPEGWVQWAVYDVSGELLATSRVPRRFRPMDANGTRVYGRWLGSEEVHMIRAYGIERTE